MYSISDSVVYILCCLPEPHLCHLVHFYHGNQAHLEHLQPYLRASEQEDCCETAHHYNRCHVLLWSDMAVDALTVSGLGDSKASMFSLCSSIHFRVSSSSCSSVCSVRMSESLG